MLPKPGQATKYYYTNILSKNTFVLPALKYVGLRRGLIPYEWATPPMAMVIS